MDLGNAVLTLTTDSTQLESGLKQAKTSTENLTVSVGTLVKGFFALEGVRAAIGVMKDCVREFIEGENAAVHLSAALRATDQEYQVAGANLVKFAEQLQRTTIYSHDATENAAAMLIQLAGLTEQGIRKAIPAVQDLASGMGIDLTQAAMMTARAMEGNVTGLQRYGIHVDLARTPSEQFDLVIQALEKHFGGMSDAMAKTTGGQLQQFTNQIKESKEEVGGFLAHFVRGYVTWFRDFIEGCNQAWHALVRVWDAWRDITNLRNPFGPENTHALRDYAEAQRENLNLASAFYNALEHNNGAMTTATELNRSAKDELVKFNESFRNVINNYEALGRAVRDVAIQAGIDAMAARYVALGESAAAAYAKAAGAMGEEAQLAWDYWVRVTTVAQNARNDLEEFAKSEAKLAWDYWTMMSGVGVKVADTDLKKLHDKYKSTYRDIMGTVGEAMRGIGNISALYYQGEYTALDNWYKKQLAELGDMTDATKEQKEQKEALDKEYAARESAIKKKEWETERGIGIVNIIMDTIEAVVQTYKTFGWPWGIIPAAIMAGLGAAQLGLYAGQPEPEFAGGADFVVPPGYEDDSYRMRVASGERVTVTPAGQNEGPVIHVIAQVREGVLFDFVTRGSRDGRILTRARSVVP